MSAKPLPVDILTQDWKEYRNSVYPEGIPADQEREVHQAFFAGALVMCGYLEAVERLPVDEGVALLEAVVREAKAVCKDRVATLNDQN